MSKQINWYPGHMFKAKKELIAQLKIIDVVVEVIDARVAISSHNLMLDELTDSKIKLLVFSKIDMVEKNELDKIIQSYQDRGYQTIAANIKNGTDQKKILKKIDAVSAPIRKKYEQKGITKLIRVLIMGMPNVGKSTLINHLCNKRKTIVGNKPGVTKAQQWVKVNENIELLDTPGILIPKIENLHSGYRLVICQLMKEEVVYVDDIAVYLLQFLFKNNREILNVRYAINDIEEFDVEQIYLLIGKKTGSLISRDEPDYDRINKMIINDYRNLKFGKVMLEHE